MKKIFTCCAASAVSILLSAFTVTKKIRLEGAWKIAEVQTVKKDGTVSISTPVESLALFHNGYYSFCWTGQQGAPHTWQQSDSLKLARLSQSIINTGTYTTDGSVLTTKPMFAANPAFVNGKASFNCSFHGDTLILTGTNLLSADNEQNPVYVAGSHVVNKLLPLK